MKHVTKVLCLAVWFFSMPVYSLNVVEGWYGGIILGANYSPDVKYVYVSPYEFDALYDFDLTTQGGKLTYSAFGNIGGLFGYRFPGGFRLEFEADYSYVPYQKLAINLLTSSPVIDTTTLTTISDTTNTTVIVRSPNHSTAIKMEGSTSSGFAFANAFYEYIQYGCENPWVPYIGIGLGWGYINNSAKLFDNEYDVNNGNASINTSTAMGQGIVGINYFLDDFTAFGMDFRYITSAKKVAYTTPVYLEIPSSYLNPPFPPVGQGNPNLIILTQQLRFAKRYEIWTINLSFTGAFNCF